jgi:hypothetical protein
MDATCTDDIVLPQTIDDEAEIDRSFERARKTSQMYLDGLFGNQLGSGAAGSGNPAK